jgi:hypothetical protein
MKDFYILIIVTLLSLPILSSRSTKEELDYEFAQEDTCYSFRGSFYVKAEPDCLINLIYNFKNISDYSLGANSIELGRQGENWYKVTFTYRKLLIFENQSTWRRTLNQDEHKVFFTMISYRNNLNILPQMLSSTGYYQFRPENDGCQVEYFQECKLTPGLLNDNYINEAKKEAIKFLQMFKEYLERSFD